MEYYEDKQIVDFVYYGKKTYVVHKNLFEELLLRVNDMVDIRPMVDEFLIKKKTITHIDVMLIFIFLALVSKKLDFKDKVIDEVQSIYLKYLYEKFDLDEICKIYSYIDSYRDKKKMLQEYHFL